MRAFENLREDLKVKLEKKGIRIREEEELKRRKRNYRGVESEVYGDGGLE